jgi:uncharacterized protein involved in exopolysaccharide biosynthesis/Mrp family chromosome partitioning ATPase
MNNHVQHSLELTGRSKKPLDIFGFVYRYGMIIFIAGLFILAMLVPVVLKMARPNYEVRASLKIDPVVASLITKSEDFSITAFYHDYVRTQARRIKEFTILTMAIEGLSEKDKNAIFPGNLPVKDCVSILQGMVTVTPVAGTHLVELSVQGPNREGLAPMLNAIIDGYLKKMEEELENKNERRLRYLTQEQEKLVGTIQTKEEELQTFATSVLSSSFSEDFNIWQKQAVNLQEAYVHSFSQRVEAENAFNFEKKKTEQLAKLSLNPLIDEAVMDNRAIDFTSSWTYQQLQVMRATIDGVTKNNEDRKRVEERMEAMREYEKKQRRETKDTVQAIAYGKRDLELNRELIKKENSFHEAQKNEEAMAMALDAAKSNSGKNSSALLHSKSLEIELSHARDLLFRIDNRIQELEAESRAPLRVTVESRAMVPETPAGSNIKKLLIFCVAGSFGGVGGLFLLLEFFDNRLRTPKDITEALGHPPSWPISRGPKGSSFLHLLSDWRSSTAAKAIRSLATRLYREYEDHAGRIFLFTAVDEKSGTTEILLNTAHALTHHVARVLVIDGNLRREDLFEKMNIPLSHPGIEDLLAGTKALEDCLYHDPQRDIDIIFSHTLSPDRVMARKLSDFLLEVKSRYDVICVDSCPVMASDFTEYLAVRADVVVVISQGDSALYKDLRRTTELFIRLGVPALAPVLNWGGEKRKLWFDVYLDAVSGACYGMACAIAAKFSKKGAAE